MATIDDFGGEGQSLKAPPLGGPGGWAAAVRDAIRLLQAGLPDIHLETVQIGSDDDPTVTVAVVGDVTTVTLGIPAGLSAYDVAVANGFEGTEADWLASMEGAPGGSDEAFAAWITDTASDTRTALDQIAVGRAASPRGGQRAALERRPALTIDQVWPNTIADYQIVHASGSTLYAVSHDTSLRKSVDGGVTWTKLYYPGGLGYLAAQGVFLKTAAGSLLTTFSPFDLSAPKIMRSVDGGVTWTDVVAAQGGVFYLGPTSIAQDPLTGYLFLVEYVSASSAANPTWKIMRSVDDGATWTTFHTFQRDADAYPSTAVRHGHGCQWDPVEQRMWFLCGDGEQASGLYRLRLDGTDIEPVLLRSQSGEFYVGAVGLMFFPDYVAWGVDQRSDQGLIRVARSQLAEATPALELVAALQSTAFYTARIASDSTEWLMTVSNEDGGGGRLDNNLHVYRVADNGATCDEVLTVPWSRDDASFGWIYPVSGSVLGDGTPLWLAVMSGSPIVPSTGSSLGYCLRVRPAWGAASAPRHDMAVRKPHYGAVTASSGYVSLPSLRSVPFAVTEAPPRATRLYVLETNVAQFVGSGFAVMDVCSYTLGTLNQTLGTGLTVDEATNAVQKTAHGLVAGQSVRFVVGSIVGVVGITAGITYYVCAASPDSFTVAATPGGAEVNITTGGTATVKFDPLPVFTVLKMEDGSTDMQWQWVSRKAALAEAGSPWIARSAPLGPGTRIVFRLRNTVSGDIADASGTITYAWGF